MNEQIKQITNASLGLRDVLELTAGYRRDE